MKKPITRRITRLAVATAALALVLGVAAPASATTLPIEEPIPTSPTDVEGPADFTNADVDVQGAFPESGPSDVVAPATGGLQNAKLGPCTLHPSGVHTRKSGNWDVVGSKPYTKCTTRVTSIQQQTTVYKVVVFGVNRTYASYPGGNRGEASYEQKNVDPHCKNRNSTTWFTVTNGTAVYGGRTYYSQVVGAKATLPCGT